VVSVPTAEPVSPSRNFQSFGGVSGGFIGGPPAKKSGVFIFYPRVDALYLLSKQPHMRNVLRVLIFPFFLLYSIIEALVAKPLHFSYSKKRGLEIGVVPLAAILLCFYFVSR